MAGGAAHFTKQIFGELGYLPTWPLGASPGLGDIGVRQNGAFERERCLADLGVTVEGKSEAAGNFGFASKQIDSVGGGGSGKVGLGSPGAEIARAGAKIELTFGGEDAAFLRVEGATIHTIENLGEVKDAVIEFEKKKVWQREWAVVTHTVEAARCIILISNSSEASATLELEGDTPIAPGKLAKGRAGLSLTTYSGMAQDFALDTPSSPLFKAQRVKWRPGGKRLVMMGRRRFRPPLGEAPDEETEEMVAEWEPFDPNAEE